MSALYLIGTGNVAHHLAKAFSSKRIQIAGVYGRDIAKAKQLAESVGASAMDDLQRIPSDALCIVAVSDDALTSISAGLPTQKFAHTSGSSSMIQRDAPSGVFYPLQTFTVGNKVDFSSIPILLEASNQSLFQDLERIAKVLSNKVLNMDSKKRAKLHVAAVLACNFTNHLFHLSEKWLNANDLPNDLLHPLIDETVRKMKEIGAYAAQTGPALRGDSKTIERHLKETGTDQDLTKIYEILTKHIAKAHGTEL